MFTNKKWEQANLELQRRLIAAEKQVKEQEQQNQAVTQENVDLHKKLNTLTASLEDTKGIVPAVRSAMDTISAEYLRTVEEAVTEYHEETKAELGRIRDAVTEVGQQLGAALEAQRAAQQEVETLGDDGAEEDEYE